jgi:hypothetical protein
MSAPASHHTSDALTRSSKNSSVLTFFVSGPLRTVAQWGPQAPYITSSPSPFFILAQVSGVA